MWTFKPRGVFATNLQRLHATPSLGNAFPECLDEIAMAPMKVFGFSPYIPRTMAS